MTATELHSFANRCAAEDAADAQTPACGDHRLGVETTCPFCWAWHVARKRATEAPAVALRSLLAEQRELSGEGQLDAIAADLAAFYAGLEPMDPRYFELLSDLVSRLATRLLPTSRRHRALSEIAAIARFDPAIGI